MNDGAVAGLAPPAGVRERGDAERLRAALDRELRSDRWRGGERLPTERELCERHGVARNTVRRALQGLEAEGLIVRHVGRGTFKAAGSEQALLTSGRDGLDGASPADVVECRLVFEPGLAALIVARASQADLDRMDECLRGAEAAGDVAAIEIWDGALHDAFAVATHNQPVIALARALARVRLQAAWGELKTRAMTPARMARLNAEHRLIVEAIRRRDKADARTRLHDHIQHVHSYMFGE